MSIRRYDENDLESDDGRYVLYVDHAEVVAERDAEIARLRDEADGEYVDAVTETLELTPHFDWSDYPDGVTADDVRSILTLVLQRADRAEWKNDEKIQELLESNASLSSKCRELSYERLMLERALESRMPALGVYLAGVVGVLAGVLVDTIVRSLI